MSKNNWIRCSVISFKLHIWRVALDEANLKWLVLKVAFCISYNLLLSNNANLEYLDAINAYDDEGGSHFGRLRLNA